MGRELKFDLNVIFDELKSVEKVGLLMIPENN